MADMVIYKDVDGREVHLFDDCVGVCWNLTYRDKQITDSQTGMVYTVKEPMRTKQAPYIDFVAIREYDDGELVEIDEESPVERHRRGFCREDCGGAAKGHCLLQAGWRIAWLI